ncbi:MAG TPA: hypothetical protein VG892_07055 [Terriglobales bacterium]|nr:hypothetical protein [Terriglobales bacterium]
MKRLLLFPVLFAAILMSWTISVFAAPLATSARAVIPADIQQIISVDYRALKASPTALALKERVLPDNMKEFESSLRGFGINPDQDVEQLTFAAFRDKQGLNTVSIAQGQFPTKKILLNLAKKKIKGTRYRLSSMYPMPGGMVVSFLDDFTMLFGQRAAVKAALDARDGEAPSLGSNSQIADMISSVDRGSVWSVLDEKGTQNMMRSTLGEAAKLADFESLKKRLLGSRYTMDFDNGLAFDLDVLTSDTMTAASLSSLVKAGVMFRKMSATGAEKTALESVTVDSDSSKLQLHFRSDEKRFQSLLQSDLFTTITR